MYTTSLDHNITASNPDDVISMLNEIRTHLAEIISCLNDILTVA